MAIVGGAIIPPLYGFLTDQMGFKIAMFLLIVCYGYIVLFAVKKLRTRKLIQLR
jgi:FHS family L-fucose permease-like MFS transporter